MARQQLLPAIEEASPDAVVLADGFSCQTQVADLTDRRAIHLVELLAGTADGRVRVRREARR